MLLTRGQLESVLCQTDNGLNHNEMSSPVTLEKHSEDHKILIVYLREGQYKKTFMMDEWGIIFDTVIEKVRMEDGE